MDDPRKQRGSEGEEETGPGPESPEGRAEPSDSLGQASEQAGETFGRLRQGPAFSLGSAELPVRTLAATGIFIAVFMAVWIALWYLLGGLGLGLGWLLAGAAGAVAVKAYADRVDDNVERNRAQ